MSNDSDPDILASTLDLDGDTMPPEAPSGREETVKIGKLHRRLDAVEAALEELRVVKKLVGWAIPSLVLAAASFVVTAAVAFYRLDQAEATLGHHIEQPATTAHPGTSDALWSIRQDVQSAKTLLESLSREHERELRSIDARIGRMEERAEQDRTRRP